MSVEQEFRTRLTAALKAKDAATANALRMIITKVMERRTAKNFTGEVNDELYLEVIAAYKKSLDKAKGQYEQAGERGAEHLAELTFESDYFAQFLPAQMTDDQALEAVKEAIAEMGISDPKMAGRVVGAVMKKHRGLVEAGLVKKLATDVLSS